MKFLKSVVVLAFSSALFIGCKDASNKPANETADVKEKKEIVAAVKPETVSFKIDGMTCAMGCAKTIEEKLADMEGVQNAKVDFETKTATVNFDLDKLKSEDLVKAAESCADGKTYKVSKVKLGNKA
jgi:periplasmic mercuric ion binding protein